MGTMQKKNHQEPTVAAGVPQLLDDLNKLIDDQETGKSTSLSGERAAIHFTSLSLFTFQRMLCSSWAAKRKEFMRID
jgi:hypothetical protein